MTPPAGPLVQKQITVIQVPTLDKNKDKANKAAVVEITRDDLMHAVVSTSVLLILLILFVFKNVCFVAYPLVPVVFC